MRYDEDIEYVDLIQYISIPTKLNLSSESSLIKEIARNIHFNDIRAARKAKFQLNALSFRKTQSLSDEIEQYNYNVRITINLIPIPLVNLDIISNFICQAGDHILTEVGGLNFSLPRKLIFLFLGAIRGSLYPHTIYFGFERFRWDAMFADTLVNILFRSTPFGSWKRLMFELMKESLHDSVSISPETSSIMKLHCFAREILDAVIDRDLATLRNLVPISKDFQSESKVTHSPAVLKYMAPALIAFEELNGMTILHCAAFRNSQPPVNSTSITLEYEQDDLEVYDFLLEADCDCVITDNSLRTSLHSAAYSLNSLFIIFMTSPKNRYRSKATSALEMLDLKGYRPIDALLYTMSISNWRLVVASKQIETCLLSLLPGEVSDALWTHAGSSEERQTSESSVFYKAIVYGDFHIAQAVANLAKKSAMQMNYSIIQDTIVQCTKRKKERSVILLLQEFGAELFAKKTMHIFLNLCISIAIWTESAALAQIFFRIYCESFPDNAQEFAPSIENSSFMYFAALKGNNAVIKAIISSGGSQCMWQILTSTREFEATGENIPRYSVLSQYSLFDHAPLVRYFQSASPLSLYCMFPSRVGTVQLLLKAMKNFHSPASEAEMDAGAGASGGSSNIKAAFSGPVAACLLRNNHDGLKTLRLSLGSDFAKLLMQTDYFGMNCLELFLEKLKLEWVSRILQLKLRPTKRRQLICRNGSEQSADSISTNVSDTIETLKTLLEILLHHLKDSNMPAFKADTFFTSQSKLPSTCNCSDAWMHDRHALQDRLQDSKKKLDDLYSIYWAYVVDISATGDVMSDNRSFTFEKLHQFIDIGNNTFISTIKGLYSSYQIWERLEKNIRGRFFYFNLRLLCTRSFLPDKNWIRIAFCLLLLIDSDAVKHTNTSNANEADAKLIWSSFTRIINNALKSADGRSAFINKLMAVSNPYPRFGTKHCPLNNLQVTSKDSIWRKIELLFNNDKFSIGNYGKGMSSSSLNKLGGNDPKGFTAMTSSFTRRNKVNDIMNLFSAFLHTFLTDCKLLDEVGPQPLPVVKPTVMCKRVLTYSDYFTICSEVDTCCKIEYLLSLTNHNGCSNSERKWNHFSVLDHLFCPTASVQSTDGSINKIQGFLRDFSILVRESEMSGMLSSSSPPPEQRSKITITPKHAVAMCFHSFQENATADLEKPVSVLLKYNSFFGFDDEFQYHLLLPLCALGLWRSAAQVLSGINNSRNSKNSSPPPSHPMSVHGPEYSAMCFLVLNKDDQFTGKELLNSYEKHLFHHIFRSADDTECQVFDHIGGTHKSVESWLSIDLDDVAVLTPLHYAIRDRKDDFIESFFQVFDKFPISIHSLLQFASNIGAADMCPTIVRRSSAFQGSSLALTPNYIRTFAIINTFPDERDLGGLSYVQYKNLSRTVSTATYTALLFALKYTARNSVEFTYPYMLIQQPPPIQHSPKVIEDSSKLLQLDGNVISMADLLAGSYFDATTLAPCPLFGGGLLATGHTIQHDFLLESTVDAESKKKLETIFQSNSWSCRVFSLNFLGCSALYTALHGGMLTYADKVLSNACIAASQATAPSSTESLQDIDEGDLSKRSNNLEMLAVHQSLQVIPEYFSTNKISQLIRERVDKDLREAEYKCKYTTAIRSGLVDHFVYGVRPYAVESACDTLAVLLKQVEYLWKLISESSFLRLIQLSYLKGSSELDSIVRSRQILTLLGIPFSRLGKTDSSGDTNTPGKGSEQDGHPQTEDTSKETSLFSRLTPDRLRKTLPWTRCCQIKELLIGWVKNRTVKKVPNIEAPIFAFKVLDVSLVEASASGTDMTSLMKRTNRGLYKKDSSYDYVTSLRPSQQSMDTLRAQSNASEAYGKLCDELKFEIRPSQSSTIYGSRVIATPSAIDSFIASIKMDPLILKDSLRLANLICDFARLLVVSRMLVSITTPSQPLDSTSISLQARKKIHPLDVIDQGIFSAKERQKELEIYLDGNRINLQTSSYLLNDGVLSMGGVNSKLRMFDILKVEDVLLFFKFPSGSSERFQRFRALICDGLIALFQDLGSNDYADFICNFLRYDGSQRSSELVRETFMKTTEDHGLNNHGASVESKEGASPDHSHLTARLVNRAAQIATSTKLQRTAQAREILTLKSGITSMVEKLRNLRIADFLSDIYAKPIHQAASQDVPFTAMKNYSTTLTSHFRMYGRHKMDISNEETKKIVDMFCNPSSVDLNIGLSSSMARNTSKDADDSIQSVVMNRLAAKDEMLAQLSKAYKIGTVFFDFLGSILHLSSGSLQSFRSVYNYDISCFLALADNYNPLCALSRSTSSYVRKPNLERSSLPLYRREVQDESNNTCGLQVSCCGKLLQLGALAHKADNFGRIPIALAALAGNYRLLECLLKSSSTEDLKTMELFPTLLWHVLMESPCFGQDNYLETFSVVTSFEECGVLLLRYEFPAEAPVLKVGTNSSRHSQLTCRINDCAMSCLELAVMKRLEKVVQAITNTVTDNSTMSENFGGVEEAGSVSRKLLFEHEAKSISTIDGGDKRWKAAYLQPQCTHLSAVHMSALCSDFDLRTIDGVYNHAVLRSRVGSIEKVSVLLQRHTHFDAIVSRHAEVVTQQLSEPLRSSSERELQFLHWVRQLGDVRAGRLPSPHLPGEDGKVDQDMVCLRFYRNWLISSRQLLQRHLQESSRRQSLMGQTCPVRRAAKIYIREVKEKVFHLEKKVGDEQIVLSPRKKKLHSTFDEDLAVPSSVDFVQFVLSSAANDEMCDLFLKRLFLSPEKLKILLLIDIDEVLLWCKNTVHDEEGRAPSQGGYTKLPLSIQRLQRIVLLACFYSRCSVVDIVYSSILRWANIVPPADTAADSIQNSTSLNSNMSLMVPSTSIFDDSTEDAKHDQSSSLSDTGSIFQLLSTSSVAASSAATPVMLIPASHRLLFRLLFDCKSAMELSYEEDGASSVSEVTPLQLAVRLCDSQVVTRLLTLTVDPSRPLSLPRPRGNTHAAVSVSISLAVEAIAKAKVTEECCVALLQRAVEENFAGSNGRASSTDSDHDSLRSFLLSQNHRVCDLVLVSGETLLHLCSRRGHLHLVKYLLEKGASPMIADENGSTSLQCSIGAGHGEVTWALFQRCPSRIKRALVVIAYILRKNMLRGHFRRRNVMISNNMSMMQVKGVDQKEVTSKSDDSHQKLQPLYSNTNNAQNRRLLLSEIIEHKLHRNLSHAEEVCEFFDYTSKSYNEELDRLGTELSTDPLPSFESWIRSTSSEIAQLKSQIMFLNYVIDHAEV